MNETSLTIVGNLTGDPELRFTATGSAVARFSVASTPRRYDSQSGQWIDGEPLFLRCVAWRDMAENVAETLTRGARVVAAGRLRANSWEAEDGQKRTSVELEVDEIGPSLRWATATVNRVRRSRPSAPQRDEWSTQEAAESSTNSEG